MKTLNKIVFAILLLLFALNGLNSMDLTSLPFPLPNRVNNALKKAGLKTVRQVRDFGENNDFESIKGIGPTFASEIRKALEACDMGGQRVEVSRELSRNSRNELLNKGREINRKSAGSQQSDNTNFQKTARQEESNKNTTDELEEIVVGEPLFELPEDELPEEVIASNSLFVRVNNIVNTIFTSDRVIIDRVITVINSIFASINVCAQTIYGHCRHKTVDCVDRITHLTGKVKSVTGNYVLRFKNITETFITSSGSIIMTFKDGVLSITKRDNIGKVVYPILKITDLSLCLGILSESFLKTMYNPPKSLILFITYRIFKKDIVEPALRILSNIWPNNFIIKQINQLGDLVNSVIKPKQLQYVVVGSYGAL